jgi:hypothetical protein
VNSVRFLSYSEEISTACKNNALRWIFKYIIDCHLSSVDVYWN